MAGAPTVLAYEVTAEDLRDFLNRVDFAPEMQVRAALAPFDPEHSGRDLESTRPVTFLIVPSRGLLGRSVRYDLLPLSHA